MRDFKEFDWKVLRKLPELALERFCERALLQIEQTASQASLSAHRRFLSVHTLVERSNSELGDCFDNPRRSQAFAMLLGLRSRQLLTDEEFALFSEETRHGIDAVLDYQARGAR
jgi:hypothetical protein